MASCSSLFLTKTMASGSVLLHRPAVPSAPFLRRTGRGVYAGRSRNLGFTVSSSNGTAVPSLTSDSDKKGPVIMEIPLDKIRRPLMRTRANDPAKVQELMDSIRVIGLQVPIDVLEVDGVYYGFSGCHRYEAHQRLGLPTIRCKVTKLLHLFSSRKRLQPPQNPRSRDDISREFEISSLVKETDMQPNPNSSSCGSFRSPCQTCSSSTLGEDATSRSHRIVDPVSLVHRVLQSDVPDMAKSNSSISSMHAGADTAIVTIPSNQEAICDQDTDDYIPLPQEEDVFEGVDDLFGLLEDENHSSESKGSSGSEDCNSFRQACVRKEDGCHPLVVNSKLRSDIERRKSVFSRIVRANEVFNQRKRSKTKAFPQRSAESFNPLYQTKKQRRAQRNKPFPCQNDGILNKPSTDRLRGVQALDNSFVWSDNRRSTKFSVRAEDRNKWDASTKEPVRDNTCRKPFVPKGSANWEKPCDKELNTPQLIAGVQESSGVSVKEESTPSLNFKRRSKGLKVEGGDQDFDNEDVVEAGQKKRSATAPFHQEHPSDTALIPKGTKTMDMLATSDGNCKEKSSSLASKDTHTLFGRPYLETSVLLQQHKSIEGCFECEDVTMGSTIGS